MGGQFFGGGGGGGTPGDAPGGAAGGDLSGTYPNPGVAKLNGVAAASYALLAGPTFTGTVTLPAATVTSGMLAGSIDPAKVTGTAVTAADTGTVTSAMILDGTIAGGDLSTTIAIPSAATATTQAATDNSTKVATNAFVNRAVAGPSVGGATPQDHSWLAWNMPPQVAEMSSSATNSAGNQVQWLCKIMTPETLSVTNIVVYLATLGGVAVANQNWAGLIASDGTRLGVSAEQSAQWGSGGSLGLKTIPLASGPFSTAGYSFVWVCLLANAATTTPGFFRVSTVANAYHNLGLTTANFAACTNGASKTTIDSPIVTANNVSVGTAFWCALS